MAAGGCRTDRKDSRSDRLGETDLEWRVAKGNDRPVSHERSYLVDSLRALSLRRMAVPADDLRRLINHHVLALSLAEEESAQRAKTSPHRDAGNRVNITVVGCRGCLRAADARAGSGSNACAD